MPKKKDSAEDAHADVADLGFEEALAALEEATMAVEGGNLPLEEALDRFERGVALATRCKQALDAAEGRVQKLLDSGKLAPFQVEE